MTKYRTYSREAFNNLKTIADASRGAYKSADAAWEEARSAFVTASQYADTLLRAPRIEGTAGEVEREDARRTEAQREAAAAHAEVQRTAAVRQAAELDWNAKAGLFSDAQDFIASNKLKPY